MEKIDVTLSSDSYTIMIENGFDSIKEQLSFIKKTPSKIALITDNNVADLQLMNFINESGYLWEQIFYYVIKHGESHKSLESSIDIYKFLMNLRIDKHDIIIAFGGGVVGDLTGYVASTYYRGIPFVQIPTTLLAQIDSSIGGKNGVNFKGIKNIIGTFYQPKLVYISTKVLNTLSRKEIRNGIAEAMVHGIIMEPDLITYIDNHIEDIYSLKEEILIQFIFRNCKIKSKIVEQDALDKGIRQILNYGHTFGHAIESIYEYRYSHGECVSMGIVAAIKTSIYLELTDYNLLLYIKNILIRSGLPVSLSHLDWDQIKARISYDKKTKSGITTFILSKRLGEVIPYHLELDSGLIRYLAED